MKEECSAFGNLGNFKEAWILTTIIVVDGEEDGKDVSGFYFYFLISRKDVSELVRN